MVAMGAPMEGDQTLPASASSQMGGQQLALAATSMPDASRAASGVKLSDPLIQSLAVGKVYRDHKGAINSLDYTQDGLHVVTAGEDKNVYVYSCEKAQRGRHLRCEKYGVNLIRFLHNDKD